jgi:hypothetical protein
MTYAKIIRNFRIMYGNTMNNGNELFLEYHMDDEHSCFFFFFFLVEFAITKNQAFFPFN